MTVLYNYTAGVVTAGIQRLLLTLVVLLAGCADDSPAPGASESDIALNNRAVALMGKFEYHAASEIFAELVEYRPQWHDVRVNYAIALKNRQQADDGQRALEQLDVVLASDADNLRANYVAGVLQLYIGEIESATGYFKAALAADSQDAYAHYYLGQCQLRSGNEDAALDSYNRAIELDPYLRSAYYSAAQVLRRMGRVDEASEQLLLFQRFDNNPNARLAEFKYTRMGPKSLAIVVGDERAPGQQTAVPAGPLFSDQRIVAKIDAVAGKVHLSTVDIDHNGSQDIFLANAATGDSRLLLADTDSGFTEFDGHPWQEIGRINAVAWGDINNDGLVDAYLCRTGPNQLWLQSESGNWSQRGAEANVADGANDCADATMVDADHDGDLDILIGNRSAADNLLNNNRNGTFRSLAENLGAAAAPGNTRQLITTDIDNDNDVDLIFVREDSPHVVLINDRLWNYVPSTNHDELITASFVSLAAVDLNADRQTELVSIDDHGQIRIWSSDNGGSWASSQVYRSELTDGKEDDIQPDLVPMDVNGDGHAELMVLIEGAFEIIALRGGQDDGLPVAWEGTQLSFARYAGEQPLPVIRSAQGISLIALNPQTEGTEVLEWGPGPGRFEFATLTFSGKHDAAETMRSNHSGIGTKISVRSGSRWSVSDTHKHSSLQGYSLQPLSVGLGGQQKADFIAVDWSDGVYQTEIDIESGSIVSITEEQRQLGSCPVLFAWNGEKFDFVTDILGVAAQGFLVEPGVLLPPRPWERVTFAPGSLASRDGHIVFKVTEPMEENSYIDAMTLESYDVPPGWKIIVDERMGTGAPEVTGNTMFYRESISPVSARDGADNDVLASIIDHDQRAMPPGEIDRRYIGLLKEMESLTLEFNQSINRLPHSPDALPVLVAESWLELPYSQTHFSAWQAGKSYRSVTLEARDSANEWHTVYPDFGIPAGMPRTMSLPLGDLPADTRALRLSWNREVYWDRIRIVYAEQPPADMQRKVLSPAYARVAKSGFYQRLNHAQRRPEYVYQQRRPFGDVKYPTGFYTNLGEMTELVTGVDDTLAIIGPGEEVHVEFRTPTLPDSGAQRWYVLDTRGWAKDKDMYTYQGGTVGPLPRLQPDTGNERREALHRVYNTRFQSGR